MIYILKIIIFITLGIFPILKSLKYKCSQHMQNAHAKPSFCGAPMTHLQH